MADMAAVPPTMETTLHPRDKAMAATNPSSNTSQDPTMTLPTRVFPDVAPVVTARAPVAVATVDQV